MEQAQFFNIYTYDKPLPSLPSGQSSGQFEYRKSLAVKVQDNEQRNNLEKMLRENQQSLSFPWRLVYQDGVDYVVYENYPHPSNISIFDLLSQRKKQNIRFTKHQCLDLMIKLIQATQVYQSSHEFHGKISSKNVILQFETTPIWNTLEYRPKLIYKLNFLPNIQRIKQTQNNRGDNLIQDSKRKDLQDLETILKEIHINAFSKTNFIACKQNLNDYTAQYISLCCEIQDNLRCQDIQSQGVALIQIQKRFFCNSHLTFKFLNDKQCIYCLKSRNGQVVPLQPSPAVKFDVSFQEKEHQMRMKIQEKFKDYKYVDTLFAYLIMDDMQIKLQEHKLIYYPDIKMIKENLQDVKFAELKKSLDSRIDQLNQKLQLLEIELYNQYNQVYDQKSSIISSHFRAENMSILNSKELYEQIKFKDKENYQRAYNDALKFIPLYTKCVQSYQEFLKTDVQTLAFIIYDASDLQGYFDQQLVKYFTKIVDEQIKTINIQVEQSQ